VPAREELAALVPEPPRRIAVFVHGLMSTEDVWRMEDGATYGALLERELGVAAFELRYNSGLRISENGEALDARMDRLVEAYPGPLDEIDMFGHSMGGLVIRSAHHAASERKSGWLRLAKRAFYIGSPHLGAPLERFGNALTFVLGAIGNPYTQLVADVINLRSAGVKDLRYANLRREDWEGADADALLQNRRHPVPLLPHIRHHLIAAHLSDDPRLAMLFGDALVSVRSATGRARPHDRSAPFPQRHVKIIPALAHLGLAHHPEVYAQIRAWCEEVSP
jgi:pimeloyl-ACP methyl ester carboxylesterase